jgi:arylsulfatase A-like enzyme
MIRWCFVLATAIAVAAPTLAADRKPNLIVIVADDMGFADPGFQGCKDIPTPNMDELAKTGVRCTNGYVSGPYCSPTRAGLLTGRYQQRFGHEFNPPNQANCGLPVSEVTIVDRLKTAGYRTGWVGKWHLGDDAKYHPQKRGFDDAFGFLGGAHSYFPKKGKTDIFRGTAPVTESEYLTDAFGREAVAFVDQNKDKPFFLYLAFNAVHTPMHATDDRLKRFEHIKDNTRRTYAAMTLAMDEAIGKLLDKLRSEKLEEDTLIVFFSDNGGPTMVGTTINGSVNTPLRGSKRTTLEGGIRVPFVFRWKGKLPAGKVYDSPIIQLDVQPTYLAAAGVAIQSEWKFDGVNLMPFLTGAQATAPHDALFWRLGPQMAVRQGDWKLVRYDVHVDEAKTTKKGSPPVTDARLYNLKDDVGESTDLMAQNPQKAKKLQSTWDKWNAELAKPLWGGGKE